MFYYHIFYKVNNHGDYFDAKNMELDYKLDCSANIFRAEKELASGIGFNIRDITILSWQELKGE